MGGGSRVRQEKLTCVESGKLPQTRARILAAWERLEGCEHVHTQPCEWVRRLVEDGDIEWQPGPVPKPAVCACVSVGSVKGSWTALREVAVKHDVTLLPELVFASSLSAKGLRCWNLRGYGTADKGYRGVAILVKRGLRASSLCSWHHREEHILVVQVEGVACLACTLQSMEAMLILKLRWLNG